MVYWKNVSHDELGRNYEMDIETYEIYRNKDDAPDERKEYIVEVGKKLQHYAEQVLGRKNKSVAKNDTEDGRKMIEFAKKERARKKNRSARKARKKARLKKK
jgi:hypothetical protein